MLIIEGSDNLGKTTAAKRIVELMHSTAKSLEATEWYPPVRYTHMTRPGPSFDFAHDYQDMMSKFAVQDRFHLGALVWHENVMTAKTLRAIEGWLYSLGSINVIFVARDEQWYKKHLKQNRKEEMFNNDKHLEANRAFVQMADRKHKFPVIVDHVIDVSSKGFPKDGDLQLIIDSWIESLRALQ